MALKSIEALQAFNCFAIVEEAGRTQGNIPSGLESEYTVSVNTDDIVKAESGSRVVKVRLARDGVNFQPLVNSCGSRLWYCHASKAFEYGAAMTSNRKLCYLHKH